MPPPSRSAAQPMLSSTEKVGVEPGSTEEFVLKLHQIYRKHVQPLEEMYKYDVFKPSWFEETILNQRPFVTFFGPWSSGKTTFINYLLQHNYLWTGPQPTTASFTVVLYGEEAGPIDGRALANAKDLPFRGLNEFGEAFVQNFQGFAVPHPLLRRVTLIDTPGVLESAKEVHERQYDYVRLSRWFAERSDLIFVLFDPTKLDAGTELRMMFKHAFKGFEGRVRIVLNKADAINTQELMRVYGSLFWNLSNIISTTEPPRVYVGSFWDQPYKEGSFTLLFSEEKTDLLHELMEVVPRQARDKKVALLIQRAKDVLTHALIVGGMRSDLPKLFGKEKAKRKAMEGLPKTYEIVGSRFKMNWRDFPPVSEYRRFLEKFDIEGFPLIEKAEKAGLISGIRECIDSILPNMLRPVRNVAAADLRDEAERDALQKLYYDSVRSQYEGKGGIQGSSDTVTSAMRPSALQGTAREAAAAPPPPPPPSSAPEAAPSPPASATSAAPTANAANSMTSQQAMMSQMMSMMQQMMLQQSQQAHTASTSSVSHSPPPPPTAGADAQTSMVASEHNVPLGQPSSLPASTALTIDGESIESEEELR